MDKRALLKEKKRIVVKIGSSSLTHQATGDLNLAKMEKLVRVLTDLKNQGKDVVLVSSGAIAVGRKTLGLKERPTDKSVKQACAAVGQAKLMMVYEKLFAEYHQIPAQVLLTKYTMLDQVSRRNAENTFDELLKLGVLPIVNENDTVATDEIEFGDNDTLSAVVATLTDSELLVILTDIDGLYTDNPRENPEAKLISDVYEITEDTKKIAGGAGSNRGTGGMITKVMAAEIAAAAGISTSVCDGEDPRILYRLFDGENVGTLFHA